MFTPKYWLLGDHFGRSLWLGAVALGSEGPRGRRPWRRGDGLHDLTPPHPSLYRRRRSPAQWGGT